MKKLLLLSFLTITIFTSRAQNADCKVLLDSLNGTYEGDCKNGKADGKGKAAGTDSYEGEFKNGLPDGNGKYIWKKGGYYEGKWKKGLKEGKGELHTIENNVATVKTGYWKKDKYIGEYEVPYRILSTTTDISRVEVNNTRKNGNSINITVKSLVDNSTLSNPSGNIAVMSDFQITRGSYNSKSNTKLTNSHITIFRDVVFPFMATLNFGNSILQIEIFEAGDWSVYVPILK